MALVKNPPADAGDLREAGSLSGSGRSPGEGNGNLLQYSCLENPVDRGVWWATAYGVAKSRTRLKWLSTKHAQWRIIKLGRGHLEKSQIWATEISLFACRVWTALLFLCDLTPEMHREQCSLQVRVTCVSSVYCWAGLYGPSASQKHVIKKLIFLGRSQQTICFPFWLSTRVLLLYIRAINPQSPE